MQLTPLKRVTHTSHLKTLLPETTYPTGRQPLLQKEQNSLFRQGTGQIK